MSIQLSALMISIRQKAGLNQHQFAEKIGVSRGSVANYELGKQDISGSKLISLLIEHDPQIAKILENIVSTRIDKIQEKKIARIEYMKSEIEKMERDLLAMNQTTNPRSVCE